MPGPGGAQTLGARSGVPKNGRSSPALARRCLDSIGSAITFKRNRNTPITAIHKGQDQRMKSETIALHGGYTPDEQHAVAVPLHQTTSYAFDDAQHAADLFDLKVPGNIYSRIMNPTCGVLEQRVNALEGGVGALAMASGMAAITAAIQTIAEAGDNIVSISELYGGTYNLFAHTLPRQGITVRFADKDDLDAMAGLIDERTKALYCESIGNPSGNISDIARLAEIAHAHGIPLMVDNTVCSPMLLRPIEHGADIVVHSATKYMGGHSDILAGTVISSEEYIEKIFQMAKNFGGSLSDYTVWLLERSIKTMGIRVKAQNDNAMKLAEFLNSHADVAKVYYPGLKDHPDHDLARKQMKGFGGMLSFELDEKLNASHFMKSLQLIKPSMSLAGVESTILLPSQTSHGLLSEEGRLKQGIKDNLLRFSVGIEEIEDLIEDLTQAIDKTK